MDFEQRTEKVAANELELKMLDWQRHGWEVVLITPASWQMRMAKSRNAGVLFAYVQTNEVIDFQVILKRAK